MGTHFAAPTEDAIVVARGARDGAGACRAGATPTPARSRRWTRSASRARITERDTVMKIFGSYHGHHDTVMVSIGVAYDKIGDARERPPRCPTARGFRSPWSTRSSPCTSTTPSRWSAGSPSLDSEGRKPACVIMEAAMMNLGVVLPEPGYLEAVREITRRHGVVLIFDEVKTGLMHRRRRRHGAVRRHAGPGHARQGARRRPARRRHRRQRGGHVGRRGRPRLPGRHLQRQPARDGRRPRQPARGPDARRLRAPRRPQRPHPRAAARRSSSKLQPPGLLGRDRLEGLRDVLAGEDHRLRDVQGQPGRRALRPGLAVQHEPRDLHDARAARRSGRCR